MVSQPVKGLTFHRVLLNLVASHNLNPLSQFKEAMGLDFFYCLDFFSSLSSFLLFFSSRQPLVLATPCIQVFLGRALLLFLSTFPSIIYYDFFYRATWKSAEKIQTDDFMAGTSYLRLYLSLVYFSLLDSHSAVVERTGRKALRMFLSVR